MSLKDEILGYITRKGEASLTELYSNFQGHSPSSVRGVVYKLMRQELVVKTSTGKYAVPEAKKKVVATTSKESAPAGESAESENPAGGEYAQNPQGSEAELQNEESSRADKEVKSCFYKNICEEYGLRNVCEANNSVICE